MKVSRLLAAVLLMSACSREPAVEREAQTTNDPAVDGTAGDEPAAPSPATSSSAPTSSSGEKPSAAREGSAARDARAAADGPVTTAAEQAGQNVSAAILEDFGERVDRYMDIRKRAAKDAPPLKETDDPARIEAAQDSRAALIRAVRADAKPGDIFTAEIRHRFRLLLAPDLEGEDGRDAKRVLRDDAPAPGAVPLEVNARYPEGAPLPTVPATLLMNLPQLPEGLEYRIIGKDLVLLDSDANLIVDYIRNAIG
jgi:hypothetical protein